MSEEKKIVELKEEDLEKVSGGNNDLMSNDIKCPCGCKTQYLLVNSISDRTILGTCTNGWEATFRTSPQGPYVVFYNKELNQTISENKLF